MSRQTRMSDPLNIQFGFGRIGVCGFRDKQGAGIMFSDCGDSRSVGDKWPHNMPNPHIPQKGDIYLHFTNVESLDVVLDALIDVKRELQSKKEVE